MYQTFTGSTRRPRQVNLSGRPSNPFTNASSSAPGTQSAIASAQQDRINRQHQRERLQAFSQIQRIWRGHSARRKTFAVWRQIWDEREEQDAVRQQGGAYADAEESLRQLRRLLLFFRASELADRKRLGWYGMRQMATADVVRCEGEAWSRAYARLGRSCLAVLRAREKRDEEMDRVVLMTLAFAVRRTSLDERFAVEYYDTLTGLRDVDEDQLRNALLAPLEGSPEAYTGIAVLLAQPLDTSMLSLMRASIDPVAMLDAFANIQNDKIGTTARSRLWLLGNVIFLANSAAASNSFTAVVTRLLGLLADDVDFESHPIDLDNLSFDRDVLSKVSSGLPLNNFLHQQINSLINEESVRNLLLRPRNQSAEMGTSTQLLASYALTLLRCFPRKAETIRMWLYRGPTQQGSNTDGATQYFWSSARSSSVFTTIRQNSRAVLSLIKTASPSTELRDGWTVILVFLELYTFLLKFTDDDEFAGSGLRPSAISLGDVADLVTFLKNLGFVLCFNALELNSNDEVAARDAGGSSLSRHFGNPLINIDKEQKEIESKPLAIAGLPGLTVEYLKGLVTGLLRAIYERDSRLHFLPADHWLMTSRFNMDAFIPAVVAEEESRQRVQDQDDEDKDDILDDDSGDEAASPSSQNPRRGGYASALRSQEARARAQRKASRKRFLESVAPRQEILQNMPFFIPFTTRVEIFRQYVRLDQERRRNGHTDPDLWRQSVAMNAASMGHDPRGTLSRHHAKIRRKNEFEDAFEQFYELGAALKEPIQITFVDEFDIPEAGIDGGGVTKEFLTSVMERAFSVKGEDGEGEEFFVENDKHLLHPNPTAIDNLRYKWEGLGFSANSPEVRAEVKTLLQQYEFLGRIIGKCLYEGILVDVSFAPFFLKKWALTGGSNQATLESGYRPNLNDLRDLDSTLYRGLLALKNAPASDVASLGLTFTVDDLVRDSHAKREKVVEHDLLPGGSTSDVTAANRLHYISAISRYRLAGQAAAPSNAFLKGLGTIVQSSWLNMFNQSELQTLIGGSGAQIDIADLRRHTLYGGTYVLGDDGAEHPSIQLFWRVMASLPDEDRRAVLKFVTSTPRGPLLGFEHLNPRFSIRDSGGDEGRWPSTSTCVNLLKLPMYRSESVLREKLLGAVRSGAGFDLS